METINIEMKEVVLNNILESKEGKFEAREIKANVFTLLNESYIDIQKAQESVTDAIYRLLSQCANANDILNDAKEGKKYDASMSTRLYDNYEVMCKKYEVSDKKKKQTLHRILEFVFVGADKTNISRYAKAINLFLMETPSTQLDFDHLPTWLKLNGGIQEVCGSKKGEKAEESNAEIMKKVLSNSNYAEFTADIKFGDNAKDEIDEDGFIVLVAVKDGDKYVIKSATAKSKAVNSALSNTYSHYSDKVKEYKAQTKKQKEIELVMASEAMVEEEKDLVLV